MKLSEYKLLKKYLNIEWSKTNNNVIIYFINKTNYFYLKKDIIKLYKSFCFSLYLFNHYFSEIFNKIRQS